MSEIIIEGVLFVALLAALGTLLYLVVLYVTPIGIRYRQTANRRRLERAAELVCPIHGPRSATDLVRLPSGDVLCPECYKETLNG